MRLFGPDYARTDRATYTIVERVVMGRRLHEGQLLQVFKGYTAAQRRAEKERMLSLVKARRVDPLAEGVICLEEEPDWFPNEGDRRWWRERHEF